MGDFASINFPCPACGALFVLSEKVAKRKIQCPCGRVFVAPQMPEALPDTEAYDVHEQSAPAQPKKTAGAALASRMDLHPHRSVKSFSTDDSEPEFSIVRDRVAPIVLLIIAMGIRVAEIPYDRSLHYDSWLISFAVLAFQIVLAVALMLGGVLVASKLMSAHFGSIGTAILKLAAIAVFGWAVGAFIVIALQYNIRAYLIAMQVMFLIYAASFAMLFSLDLQEAVATVVICALLQDAAALVVFSTS
jgi:hypothetical protein